MKVVFLEPASREFLDAIEDYDHQREGLERKFAAEVKSALGRILMFPDAWPPLSKRTRRCRLHRFPYGVIYQVRGETILVVAVFHLSREPGSWKIRLAPGEQ